MPSIGVARLKAHLSRYLEQVKHGQEVVVTERGIPVAKIVPLRGSDATASRRERLARAGVLDLGSGRARHRGFKPPRGSRRGYGVLEALLEERREGR